MKNEVNIFNETVSLFDFETFSVHFVEETGVWFLEIEAEEEELKRTIILEDKETSFFEENKTKLDELEFFQKDFDGLKKFVKEQVK